MISRMMLFLFVALAINGAAANKNKQRTYTVSELRVPGMAQASSSGINDSGDVVGWALDANNNAYAFFRSAAGRYRNIGIPNSSERDARGINNSKQIVGMFVATGDPKPWHTQGYLLQSLEGQPTVINYPGAVATYPSGINDLGQVSGYWLDSSNAHGFIWERGKFTDIAYPGASSTQVHGIDNQGQAVGNYTDAQSINHGFVWSRGNFTTLDPPVNPIDISTYSAAFGLSRAGIIGEQVVYYFDHQDLEFPFRKYYRIQTETWILSNGVYSKYEVPNSSMTLGTGINNNGTIAGQYTLPASAGVIRAFIAILR